jgi:Zn-dependent protease
MGRAFRVARIAGIDIEIHPSWLLILAFVSWSLSDSFFPSQYETWSTAAYWIAGVSSAVLLFVTVLIHEMAHALVARRRGLPVPRITLFIFGGMSHMSRQPATAGEEFQIAAAGPATSLVIAALTAGLGLALRETSEKAEAILFYLAFVNLALGIFNILPGFPLDGGRVLRSIAWKRTGSFRKATRVASSVGEFFGYGLIIAGFFVLLAGGLLDGLWLAFIGWFLHARSGDRERLHGGQRRTRGHGGERRRRPRRHHRQRCPPGAARCLGPGAGPAHHDPARQRRHRERRPARGRGARPAR